jgi:glycosyltransferase involved in cell wall biosynthesis
MDSHHRQHPRIRVGTQGTGYVQKRLLGSLARDGVSLVRVYDAMALALHVQRLVSRDIPATAPLNCLHSRISTPPVDLYHLVNTLSFTHSPWIVSFEHYVPRWNVSSRLGLGLLARPYCRRLHAMSEFARKAQRIAHTQQPELLETLDRKTLVLHPPQQLTVPEYSAKPVPQDGLVFTFVGREFFRKGGAETLRAASRLLTEGFTFTLHVVSTLEIGDYITRSTEAERQKAIDLMKAHRPSIIHHGEMANAEVLQLLAKSHVALLPTYDDTYGFSVLEAQSAGTPVITTNVCALPEINNDEIGWMIKLTLNEMGEATHLHDSGRAAVSEVIERGIYEAMRDALMHRESVRAKGEAALRRLASAHDPDTYADRIHSMYREVLGFQHGGV